MWMKEDEAIDEQQVPPGDISFLIFEILMTVFPPPFPPSHHSQLHSSPDPFILFSEKCRSPRDINQT